MSARDDELAELLGAYALDAVDDDERSEIEDYLARSPRARAEVAAHVEVAALLGGAPAEAPAALWDRIDALLPVELLRLVPIEGGDDPAEPVAPTKVSAISQRRIVRRWIAATVGAAAAAAAIIGLGVSNVRQDRLLKDYRTELAASRDGAKRLDDLLAEPGTRVTTLRNSSGRAIARVILAASGEGYLVDSGLPHLHAGRTYQLWGVDDGLVLSLGVMADSDRPIPLAARGSWTKLVLTEEQSPGVVTSAQPAMAAGTVSS